MSARFRRVASRGAVMSEINVVPYVDVMLVLLVVFMTTAPLMMTGIEVDVPKADSDPLEASESSQPLVLAIAKDGSYRLSGRRVSEDDIIDRAQFLISSAKKRGQVMQVLVAGDRGVSYGHVIKGMALLQVAGAARIGLITDEEEP